MSTVQPKMEPIEAYYQRAMQGHVYVEDTVTALLDVVARRIARLGPEPIVLELGSHAGLITEALLDRCPQIEVIISDQNEEIVALARRRLSGRPVSFHVDRLECLSTQVDMVVSLARHHHLPHDYLPQVRRLLRPRGFYLLADELCPEYCVGEHAARIAQANVIHMAGGYVLTSNDELRQFQSEREVPSSAIEVEDLRRRALWRWYRFVVDHAVERGYFDIAAGELQSTRDDLETGSDAEHKFGPLVVERQLALAGFNAISKQVIGPVDQPEFQSMHVYEFQLAADS